MLNFIFYKNFSKLFKLFKFSSAGQDEGEEGDHILISLSRLNKLSSAKLRSLEKSIDSALEKRRVNCGSRSESLALGELIFMCLHVVCCVMTIIVTWCWEVKLWKDLISF